MKVAGFGEGARDERLHLYLVCVAVEDNGPGIPSEHREKIFNLYFSTKPGGTGLGLPMVKKIVEDIVCREYDIDRGTALRDVTDFVQALAAHGVLETSERAIATEDSVDGEGQAVS